MERGTRGTRKERIKMRNTLEIVEDCKIVYNFNIKTIQIRLTVLGKYDIVHI